MAFSYWRTATALVLACSLSFSMSASLVASASASVPLASRTASKVNVTCPDAPLAAGTYTFSVPVDGLDRTFLVHVPRAVADAPPGTPAPLFFSFHGWFGTAESQNALAGMAIVRRSTSAQERTTALGRIAQEKGR